MLIIRFVKVDKFLKVYCCTGFLLYIYIILQGYGVALGGGESASRARRAAHHASMDPSTARQVISVVLLSPALREIRQYT